MNVMLQTIVIWAMGLSLMAPVSAAETATEQPASLADHMSAIKSSLRAIKRMADGGQISDDAVAIAQKARQAAVAARELPPKNIVMLPEAERDKQIQAYQAAIDVMVAELATLETLAGSKDAAKVLAQLAKLSDVEKDGHQRFRQ